MKRGEGITSDHGGKRQKFTDDLEKLWDIGSLHAIELIKKKSSSI